MVLQPPPPPRGLQLGLGEGGKGHPAEGALPWSSDSQTSASGSSRDPGPTPWDGFVRGVGNFLSSVSSQQKFEAMDIKALGRTMSQLSERLCYSSWTGQCHSSMLQLSFI